MGIFLTKKYIVYKGIGLLFLLVFFFFLYKLYIPRINAFSCFDDCNNFMGGYFLLHGKKLFSEIFFNHAPFMAYISAAIQLVTRPINLYELILRHRQFVMGFGFCMTVALFFRFGFKIIAFSLLYEQTKFYIFGDRFLAEGIVVYVVIYLAALGWGKLQKEKLSFLDFLLSAVATWFVIFTREPYIPLTIFLYGFLLWGREVPKQKLWSFCLFLVLSTGTIFYHNVSELIFNVFTTNAVVNIPTENAGTNIFGIGIWKVLFYPISLYFGGQWGFFRYVELMLNSLFILLLAVATAQKKWVILLFIFVTLSLANLRVVTPGHEFYESFHMIIWYGLFLFFSMSLFVLYFSRVKLLGPVIAVCYVFILGYCIFSSGSFTHDRINEHDEYIINFGHFLQVGNVIDYLSLPKDTLFLDGTDDIIYWVSHRYSQYKYSWYTSLMPAFTKYTSARSNMLSVNPPEFYYGRCTYSQLGTQGELPSDLKVPYVRLLQDGKPSCLWVKKSKIPSISQEQWDKARAAFYTLP